MRGLSFIRIVCVVGLSCVCVLAQTQQAGAGTDKADTRTTGAITGRVVDESGQAIQNAVVSAFAQAGTYINHLAVTDREGSFQIDGLEPNVRYYVRASMPAYTTPRERGSSAPTTHTVGDSVTLTLIKGGVITGKVTNAAGEPLVGIRVRAERIVRTSDGRRQLGGEVRDWETDDRGIYRIYGLPAGSYVVMAGGATQAYSTANIDPFDRDVPTFAPSSTRDTAAEITLRSGDEIANIDIAYRGEQGRTISGVVPGTSEVFNVTLTPVGDPAVGELWRSRLLPDMNGRSFSFVGVADGDYDLYAYAYSSHGEQALSEVKRIRVRGADVTGIELTPRPFASVAGRVVLEETNTPECTATTRPKLEEMIIGAWHNDTAAAKQFPQAVWSRGVPAKPDAQGNFVLRNLAPAEYYFVTRLTGKNWYLRSVQLTPPGAKKPVDASRFWTNVRFGDQLSGLAITLAQGGGTLRGQLALAEGEQVPARTFIYLAPVERERAENPLSYFGTAVNSEGKFGIHNIAPGRYWVFAQTVPEGTPLPLFRIRFPHETETRAQVRREAEAAKTEIEFKPCQDVVDFKVALKP